MSHLIYAFFIYDQFIRENN